MKNKNKILLFSIILFITLFFNNEQVEAIDGISGDYVPGISGDAIKCSSNRCYRTGSSGFRIAIVDKNGNRCKYDQSTNTLCGNTGTDTQAIDYWFDADYLPIPGVSSSSNVQGVDYTKCFAYDSQPWLGRRIKSEAYSASDSNITSCNSVYGTVRSIDELDFPTSEFEGTSALGTYNNPKNGEKIFEWLKSYKPGYDDGQIESLNTILYNATYNRGNADDITAINGGDYSNVFLQFEQLASYYNLENGKVTREAVGTVIEVTKIWERKIYNQVDIDYLFCYIRGGKISGACYDGSLTGWIGVKTSDFSPAYTSTTSFAEIDKKYINLEDSAKKASSYLKINYTFAGMNYNNITWFSLKDILNDTCTNELNQLLSTGVNETKLNALYYKYLVKGEQYLMLLPQYYNDTTTYSNATGTPACATAIPKTVKPIECPASSSIDNCKTGVTKFTDNVSTSCWLDNDTSYEFSTASGSAKKVKSIENDLGDSTYCPVYCYETFETDFPISIDASAGLKSGLTFFWGKDKATGTFGKVRVTRTCQTKYNNYEELFKQYVNKVQRMIRYYLMYQAYSDYYIEVVGEHGGSCDGDEKNRCYSNKDSYYSSGETSSINISRRSSSSSCGKKNGYRSCDEKMDEKADKYYDYYKDLKKEVLKLQQALRNCTGNQESISGKIYQGTKESSVSSVDKSAKVPYNMNTDVYVNYIDKIDTSKSANNLKLTKNGNLTKWQNKVTFNSCSTSVKIDRRNYKTQINYWACSGDSCDITDTKPVINCDNGGNVTFAWDATYSYVYPDTYKWYSKSDETVISANTYSTLSQEQKNLTYFIGYGFPTSIKLSSGKYKISASVNNIGHNGHFNQLINNLKTTASTEVKKNIIADGYKFECTYEIDNDITDEECVYDPITGKLIKGSPEYCDPTYDDEPGGLQKELDIVYRVIDLTDPFPGKDGSGRSTGSNWSEYSSGAYDDLFTNVYSKKPIYSITLDVATIGQIRDSNKEYKRSGNDPYTSYYDKNNKLKIQCVTGTDRSGEVIRYCASDYLTSLMTSGKLTGTCTKKTTTNQRAQSILNASGNC